MPGPGTITTQPNAVLNTADKIFAQLIGALAVTVDAIATLVVANS